jgi:hypothetical protein
MTISENGEQRGACFVQLQEPELAFPALQEALKQYPTLTREGKE